MELDGFAKPGTFNSTAKRLCTAPPEDTDEDLDITTLFDDLDDQHNTAPLHLDETVPDEPLVAEAPAEPPLDAQLAEPTLDAQPAESQSRQPPPATEGQPADQTENVALTNPADFATSEATIVLDAKGRPATKCVNCGKIYEKNHGIKVHMAKCKPPPSALFS